MRIVVTGATGNVGTAVVERLAGDERVTEIVGVSRRRPSWSPPLTTWQTADVARDDLVPILRGADAVVHLAWQFHPTRHHDATWSANVDGSGRVLAAALAAEVPAVVVASSVGAYAPRTDLSPVDESFPATGCPSAAYSREKAAVERLLDEHEAAHPEQRVVRLRPAFIFQRRAAVSQRRIFLGPLVPHLLLRPGVLPVLPVPTPLHLQAVHAEDVADAYAAAALGSARGAFNITADEVLGPDDLVGLMRSRRIPVPSGLLRAAVGVGFRMRAVPIEPGLLDLALAVPMMDNARARSELGWSPRHTSAEAIEAFLDGLRRGDDAPTAPLSRATSGRFRSHEWITGVGARDR